MACEDNLKIPEDNLKIPIDFSILFRTIVLFEITVVAYRYKLYYYYTLLRGEFIDNKLYEHNQP